MSISKRLFIGNIHSEVKEDDLKSRFGSFGTVEAVVVRSKNDDHFAFMDMVFEDIHAMRKCVDALNNTRWKGLTLKVQYAKESFLEKLKREREQNQQGLPNKNPNELLPRPLIQRRERRPIRPEKPKPPDNFDFEIVGVNEIKNKNPPSRKNRVENACQAEPKREQIQPTIFVLENEDGLASNLVGFQEAKISSAPPPQLTKSKQGKREVERQKDFKTIQPMTKKTKTSDKSESDYDTANDLIQASPFRAKEPAKSTNLAEAQIDTSNSNQNSDVRVQSTNKTKKVKLEIEMVKKESSDSEDSESDDCSADEKDGIPKFRGLASFGEALFSGEAPVPIPEVMHCQPLKLTPLPLTTSEVSKTLSPSNGFKLQINPNKKAKSDELRLKSLTAREHQLNQRSTFVRQSLSKIEPPSTAVTNPPGAQDKAALFADDEDAQEGDQISFNVKPQYEGKTGQKMLKLKAKYGGDERFQLDERFAGSTPTQENSSFTATEKNLQLGILEELVGPTAPESKPPSKTNQNKGFIRFDPTLPEHQKLILNPEKFLSETVPVTVKSEKSEGKTQVKKEKLNQKEMEKAIEEEKAKLRDPTAKPTFKVAENLKTLFSAEPESNSAGSFSLLQKFGSDVTKNATSNDNGPEQGKIKGKSKPRDNWNKNPFKYDSSSSDEEEIIDKKKKKLDGPKTSTPIPGAKQGAHSFFKKESFFFIEKDERLKGVFEQFLKSDENPAEVSKMFNESGRQELKAIAQSKMKNAKRKVEKKMNFMKLLRKKKKREALAKQKKNEERRALFQSQKNAE